MSKAKAKKYVHVHRAMAKYLRNNGIVMSKQIHSGGLFTGPTYDRRTVFTFEEMQKLNREGFIVATELGVWIFNALMMGEEE